jgi:protein phosphatase
MAGMRVRFAGETNTGKHRGHNEDYLYLPEDERVVMVADGMGGHSAGDVASRMAVEAISSHLRLTANEKQVTWPFVLDRDSRRETNRMVSSVKLANLAIYEKAQREGSQRGMGTTIVAVLFADDTVILAHVGDSRIYRVRDGQLEQLTEDHSLLNDYIKMKRIKLEDAEDFRYKNVIVRALGMKETISVDVLQKSPRVGDTYLLCSDGLWGMLNDDQLLAIVQAEQNLDRSCERLVAAANDAGGMDNITVALARIEPAA